MIPNPSASFNPSPGDNFGDYRLIKEIGRFGTTLVWEAEEINLKRRVALKIFAPKAFADWVDTERFKREAQASSQLKHPAVVRIFARGDFQGIPFIAEELIEGGKNLSHFVKAWKEYPVALPLNPWRTVAVWFAKIAEPHQSGILYRDIKPANL